MPTILTHHTYNELELRVTFLLCRDTWLQQALSSIPDSNPYTYVKFHAISSSFLLLFVLQLNKFIDQSRTHLFDIINQYKAIFSDDSSSQDDVCYLHYSCAFVFSLFATANERRRINVRMDFAENCHFYFYFRDVSRWGKVNVGSNILYTGFFLR